MNKVGCILKMLRGEKVQEGRVKSLLLFLFFVNISILTSAQIAGIEVVPVIVHTGEYGDGVDLNGYVTWHIYVIVEEEDDHLSAIYGTDYNVTPGLQDDEDIFWEFDCNLFQHEFAGPSSLDNNCAFWPSLPSMEFDSFFTIEALSSCDPDLVNYIIALPLIDAINTFEGTPGGAPNGDYFDGGTFFVDDGAYYTLNDGVNGIAGPDLKILIAQLTTCGGFELDFGVQIFEGGIGDNPDNEIFHIEAENPCTANPIDTSQDVIIPLNCFGETATIEFGEGGNGEINYEVWDQSDSTLLWDQLGGDQLAGFEDGCYFISMMDTIGCTDTSEVFCFIEPPLLELASALTADILCFDDATGIISNLATGGTDPLTFFLNDDILSAEVNNSTYENLGCGDYEIKVIDEFGCTDSTVISVSCPTILSVASSFINSSCFDLDNGSITATLSGGTGSSTVTWSSSVDLAFNNDFSGNTPLVFSISDLEPAIYTASIVDANNCTLDVEFEITEPDPMTTIVTPTDASCNSLSDGSIEVVASGGTPDFNYSVSELGGGTVDFDGLPVGDYVVVSVDDSGCQIIDTISIGQPAAIVFDSLIVQDVSCFGLCDGFITFAGLGGGEGNIVLTSIPALDPNVDNNGFIEACQQSYTILALDESNNCTYSLGSHTIIEPAELIMTVDAQDITCFGANNGSLSVECAGGTGDIDLMINDSLLLCGALLDSLAPGIYEVMLIDESQCFTSNLFELTEPEDLILQITDTIHLLCGGDDNGGVLFDISGGTASTDGDPYTFLLNGINQTLVDLIQLEAGQYQLCAQDANLCLACDSFAVLQPEPINFLFNITNTSCTGMDDGGLNVFAGGGTGPITISFEPANLDINNLSEGEYVVYAVDSAGCMAQDTALVEANILTDLSILLFETPLTCWNTGDGSATVVVLGGMAPYEIQWGDPDLQTTTTAVGLSEGSYQILVTDGQGCEADSLAQIVPNEGCFFIATAITPNGDGANDEWIIGGLEYFPTATVQVYNRWGQILFESRGTYVPWDATYNGRKVSLGDYYFLIKYDDNAEPITGTVTIKY
ncbi:MAG: gliding motility-associated-like protein [Flavobacteriales bacterium]|jgi:gliding motility-associated-like protein